jgi:hypothetical protein
LINEIQRQAYLSVLGIENYMPRWCLPFAPEPVACVLPESGSSMDTAPGDIPAITSVVSPVVATDTLAAASVAVDVLASLDAQQKSSGPVNAASILEQLEKNEAVVVTPFSLNVWRPVPGFLIIDSRNTALALPTDLLLNNILRHVIKTEKVKMIEEVLRWPMIENRFVSRTEIDARNELQTWLAVENELRPINRLWLLGENASKYFIAADMSVTEKYWQNIEVNELPGQTQLIAFLMPSLNELLQNPLNKARLWAALD